MKTYIKTTFTVIKNSKRCNYKVEATIEGEVQKSGMVVDFGEVKRVLRQFDHTTLNDAKAFDSKIPTAENLAKYFAENIRRLGSFDLIKVTVWKTEDCSATIQIVGVKR